MPLGRRRHAARCSTSTNAEPASVAAPTLARAYRSSATLTPAAGVVEPWATELAFSRSREQGSRTEPRTGSGASLLRKWCRVAATRRAEPRDAEGAQAVPSHGQRARPRRAPRSKSLDTLASASAAPSDEVEHAELGARTQRLWVGVAAGVRLSSSRGLSGVEWARIIQQHHTRWLYGRLVRTHLISR